MNGRAGKVLAIAVAVLVLLAVVAGVLSANRPRAELPEGSPEAVVQQYVTDVFARDLDAAAAHLDPDGECTVEDLEMAFLERDARVVLRSTDVDGDSATVRIELVHTDSAPFGGSEWTQEEVFRLADPGGGWVITGAPWPMFNCNLPEGVRP
ncbi:nuclear transport factor 2 family protein [Ornithinimicrobium sp. W1679]|uniref:nuclear transport factor 2 family protein n=1 Tax=unclassified Ornithinimicrobium TaxID=2615080 RepID=UPI003CEE5351